MHRMRVASVHKIASLSILAILLFSAPHHLAAQEREAAAKIPAITWLSTLWSNLTTWLAGELPSPPPESPAENRSENSCAIDPNGGCGG